VRLLQRQEAMKGLTTSGPDTVRLLDPGLRRSIRAGWDAVSWSADFDRLVERLTAKLRARYKKRRATGLVTKVSGMAERTYVR